MYPAPPPSRLPDLLVGTFKVLSWLTGGSTVLIFIYYVRTAPLYPFNTPIESLWSLAIPPSSPYAVGTRPSLAQGPPKRPAGQAHSFLARL